MLDLFLDDRRGSSPMLLAIGCLLATAPWSLASAATARCSSGMFVRDTMADVLKVAILGVSALSLVYAWPYLRERGMYRASSTVLVLFATSA
jgi:NADH-quinone oxidoreductase subunit N